MLIVSLARRALDSVGSPDEPGGGWHGRVAGWIKDSLERELGEGSWQCVVGRKGGFGSCLSPAAHQYFNFDLENVTVLVFKAS